MEYCFKSTHKIRKELNSPLYNPAIVDNFESNVGEDTWIFFYTKWLESGACESFFDKDNPKYNPIYDADGDGEYDNYTLEDPRLQLVYDEEFDKEYYVFRKNWNQIVYMDDSRNEDGHPYIKTMYYDTSQTVRDIIMLEDMDLADPIDIQYKEKLYNDAWETLDPDVQILRKNDLAFFPNDPEKSLIMNKIILDLNNPLKNPLLVSDFDSGLDPFYAYATETSTYMKRIVVPPTMNQNTYDVLMKEFAEETADTFFPTFLQDDYNVGQGIYDADLTGIFDNDAIQDGVSNGDIQALRTNAAPVLIFKKDSESITYYDPDTGLIEQEAYDWDQIMMNIAILEANMLGNESYTAMKETILIDYILKLNDTSKKLSMIDDTLEEVKAVIITYIDYLSPNVCKRLNEALDIRTAVDLEQILEFSDCVLKNYHGMMSKMRRLGDIQKLITTIMSSTIGAGMYDIKSALDALQASMEASLRTDADVDDDSVTYTTQPQPKYGDFDFYPELLRDCILAKTLLEEKLRYEFPEIKEAINRSDTIEDMIELITQTRYAIPSDSMTQCLDKTYPAKGV